jgi:hypothetical protein
VINRTAPTILVSAPMTPAAAGVAIGAPIGIRNNDDVGVLIDQFMFDMPTLTGVTTAGFAGPEYAVSLRYKGEPLTNGWVSLPGCCPVQNEQIDRLYGQAVRLAKPMYLAPGEWIDVSVRGDHGNAPTPGGFATFGTTVTAYARGRFADPPAERWLPYLATYTGTVLDGTTNVLFSMASTPQDLGNPFRTPLLIERLVGRVIMGTSAATLNVVIPNQPVWAQFKMILSDDQARLWIPTPTPLYVATNLLTRSWRLNYMLPPQSFLRATIEGTATWNAGIGRNFAAPLLGMVGYRRIG